MLRPASLARRNAPVALQCRKKIDRNMSMLSPATCASTMEAIPFWVLRHHGRAVGKTTPCFTV